MEKNTNGCNKMIIEKKYLFIEVGFTNYFLVFRK